MSTHPLKQKYEQKQIIGLLCTLLTQSKVKLPYFSNLGFRFLKINTELKKNLNSYLN